MAACLTDEALPSFSRLPPELIHRIASFGTCSSALNLRLVCRAFYQICDSRCLFRGFIHDGNGLVLEPSGPRWMYREDVLSMQQPAHVWARYALADEKARKMLMHPVYVSEPTALVWITKKVQVLPKALESWMPQLCALHRRYTFDMCLFYSVS